MSTRYPLVLVPGMLGFVRLVFYPYWYGIIKALRRDGATVLAVQVSPLNSTEVRGEQLLRGAQPKSHKTFRFAQDSHPG